MVITDESSPTSHHVLVIPDSPQTPARTRPPQLAAWLLREPYPYSVAALTALGPVLERRSAAAQRLQRACGRFWVLEYLRRSGACAARPPARAMAEHSARTIPHEPALIARTRSPSLIAEPSLIARTRHH